MKPHLLIFIVCFVFYAHNAYSWGGKGHRAVALIAKSQLSQSVIDSVDYYLEGTTWEDAAGWMDDVHEDHDYDFMRPWHYVNIDKDKTYVVTKTPNIINELDFVIPALENRKKYKRDKTGLYIKILFHLIGDLHQPLHCGYKEDRGGNDFQAIFDDRETNLHKVWDFEIIKAKEIDEKDCIHLIKTWAPEKIAAIKKATVLDCVNESRTFLPLAYSIQKKATGKYITASAAVIKEQLAKAGLRLANVLNECFKK